jgi:hypothetical protein
MINKKGIIKKKRILFFDFNFNDVPFVFLFLFPDSPVSYISLFLSTGETHIYPGIHASHPGK